MVPFNMLGMVSY